MAEKILIVDDDPETVKFLSLLITRLGYEPLQAQAGIQALKLAHEQLPNLIVLDVMMPGIDGYEVARSLRRHPETASIPILMFTAKSQVEDKQAGYEVGVDIYLTKPVHPIDLAANIKALLSQQKARTKALSSKGYVVGVLAARGGVGVSTVTLNLAIAYCKNRKVKVIAAEMRPGQGTWGEELGLTNVSGLNELLQLGRHEITPVAVENKLTTNFGVPLLLATNEPNDSEIMNALAQYEAIVAEARQLADLVVLDIGTNFHPAYAVFTSLCDEMVLVTESQPVTIKRTRHLVTELKSKSFGSSKVLTLITVNHARTDMAMSVSQIEDTLGQSVILGFPPAPELAYQSAIRATPMYLVQPGGIISKQFDFLAEHIAKHIPNKPAEQVAMP